MRIGSSEKGEKKWPDQPLLFMAGLYRDFADGRRFTVLTVPAGADVAPVKPEVSFADFEKIDLRVGVVESCELVPKSSKLLKLVIDAGALGKRTIFSGIRGAYPDPAALVGKEVAFVANLAPRKMSVGVSEGMVLFAGTPGEGGGVVSPDAPAGGGATVS